MGILDGVLDPIAQLVVDLFGRSDGTASGTPNATLKWVKKNREWRTAAEAPQEFSLGVSVSPPDIGPDKGVLRESEISHDNLIVIMPTEQLKGQLFGTRPVIPSIDMTLTWNSTDYEITSVSPISTGVNIVAYIVELKN